MFRAIAGFDNVHPNKKGSASSFTNSFEWTATGATKEEAMSRAFSEGVRLGLTRNWAWEIVRFHITQTT